MTPLPSDRCRKKTGEGRFREAVHESGDEPATDSEGSGDAGPDPGPEGSTDD